MDAALAQVRPGVQVVGVEAAGAAAMRVSLDAGRVVRLDRVATMADGVSSRQVCDLTLAHAQVADIAAVDEEEISRALLLLLERTKAVLTGGNIDPLLLVQVIRHGLSAAGRFVGLSVVLRDEPGALAGLLSEVVALGLNVLDVAHQRAGARLGLQQVEVRLSLETCDPAHRDEVGARLRDAGYQVDPVP